MSQEIFNFHQTENLNWSDFIESEENREAVSCLSFFPKSWNSNGVIIYGGPKVGKTHLASLWAQVANAVYILKSGFRENPRTLFEANCNFVIDNFDKLYESETNQSNLNIKIDNWMFDFFNICREKKRFFLLTARTPPSMWNINLKDLKSRFNTLPVINMRTPGDDLLLKITQKIAKDFGISISDEIISYLMNYITRDVPTLSDTIKTLDKIAMQKQKAITIPFVKKYVFSKETED